MNLPKSRYEQTKVNDTPRIVVPIAVQDVFSIVSIDESGVFELMEKKFSKLYALSDMNFAGVTDDEQKNIIHLRDFKVDEIVRIAGWDKDKEQLIYEKVYPIAKVGD